MMDQRLEDYAGLLVNHATNVQKGDKVLIEVQDTPEEVIAALVRKVQEADANPVVNIMSQLVQRELLMGATKESMKLIAEFERPRMERMDAYINIRGMLNPAEMSDVPEDKTKLWQEYWWNPVHKDVRVPATRWVVSRFPHPTQASDMGMSRPAYEDFFFKATVGVDYNAMAKAAEPLVDLMKRTKNVHIVSNNGTDLYFSIDGLGAVPCVGNLNIPDGEVFTAPVKDSVNGTLVYSAKAVFEGKTYENIRFVFKDGKIIEATADGAGTEAINAVLDRVSEEKPGARFIGEFALGFNPYIKKTVGETLFDEKIMGSFHFTPGDAYQDCPMFSGVDNGNRALIHWDLVSIQTPEYGGGEIYFDDVLIRKDGLFVLDELKGLNPENLAKAD